MRKALMSAVLAFAATSAFAWEVSRDVNLQIARGRVQRVVVDIPAGEIHIRNGESNSIALDGEISRHFDTSNGRSRMQRILDDSEIEIAVEGEDAIIRRRFGKNARGWRARNLMAVDIRLDLPPDIDLDIETRFGEVTVEGTFRSVRAELSAGEIDFRAPRKTVGELNASCRVGEVHADLGDRIVTREGIFPGTTHWINNQGKGQVDLHVTAGTVRVRLTE